jgi:predicted membrane-bound spermidine synthase
LTMIRGEKAGPALLLAASGMVALIFQVLWIKQLSLIVGVDVYAVSTGVSAFFAGLALGGLVLGRWADRSQKPLRLYAALEIGVAVLGVATTYALAHSARLFATLEAQGRLLPWALVFILVGLAPFLMGGTLPAIVRSLCLQSDRLGSGGGRMYAANTSGAILGALGSSFLLLPALGIQGAAWAAGGIGMLAAAAALWLDRFSSRPRSTFQATSTSPLLDSAGVAILFYSVAGGLALGYEVVWSQTMVSLMSTRSFAFSVMLATYLFGLALGAGLFARWADRVRNPWGVFGLLIATAGLLALLEVTLIGPWLPEVQGWGEQAVFSMTGSRMASMCTRFAIASGFIVLGPTLLLGAAFPAALKLIVDAGHVGRDVGRVVAYNTLGGIAGSVITGFLLIPRFGLVKTLAILAVGAALIGMLAARRGESGWWGSRGAVMAVAVVALIAAFLTPSDRLASLLIHTRGGSMVFYTEGRGGTVGVLEQAAGSKRFRRLYIQGVSNTGDTLPSLRYMRLQALLPLIIHSGEPKSALVIGLGTGITAGALLAYPELEHRVVAELLPEVRAATASFQGNFDAAMDPRLDIRLRDGRRELLSNPQVYDLITLEPPPPSAAGVANLYSSDFYHLARARLRPDGIVAQWLPLPTQNDEDSRSLVRSFLDVFPQASLWTTEFHEMLLVGSVESLELDVTKITERFNQPEVLSALTEVGVATPAALMATWITDRAGLESYAGDVRPVTDDQPRIEYADWVRPDEIQRVLPSLIGLRTDPPLRNAEDSFLKTVVAERQRLLVFYQAALNGQSGHPELWARDMQRVRKAGKRNAYYEWFEGTR